MKTKALRRPTCPIPCTASGTRRELGGECVSNLRSDGAAAMAQKPYETKFLCGITALFDEAGISSHLLHRQGDSYRPLIRGSGNSEADGAISVGSGVIFIEIDKKDYASDNVAKYHRALSLGLLTVDIKGRRLALVQAFITKNMKPLRVKNALHLGTILARDFGVVYISAESKEEDIPALVNQLREPLLNFVVV